MSARTPLRRGLGLAALALVTAAAGAAAQQLPPAQQIVEKYVQAIGGRDAVARFPQRHIVSEMTMTAQGVSMTSETYSARPHKTVTKTEVPGMGTFRSGYDGAVAWSIDPMGGPRVLEGKELSEALRQASFDGPLDPAKAYTRMETTGEKTVAGRPCWTVKMVTPAGIEVTNCYDKENGLLVHASLIAPSQMGDLPTELTITEYRDFDGVKMPARTVMSVMGQEMVSTVKSVSHAPFDASVFALPAEIQALRPAGN